MLFVTVSGAFVGFGAVVAALAGHQNHLVIITLMLMMIAYSYRSTDFDL